MTHDELKEVALQRDDVKKEYDALAPEFELLRVLLKARHEAGLTQAQVAERMGTQASAVARLESALADGRHSPSKLKRHVASPRASLRSASLPEYTRQPLATNRLDETLHPDLSKPYAPVGRWSTLLYNGRTVTVVVCSI